MALVLAGALVVVREEREVRLEVRLVDALHALRDRPMERPALREQHEVVADLLRDRVEEAVGPLRVLHRERRDEREPLEDREVAVEARLVRLDGVRVPERAVRELAADDARDLQDELLRRREAVDALGDDPLDRRGRGLGEERLRVLRHRGAPVLHDDHARLEQ